MLAQMWGACPAEGAKPFSLLPPTWARSGVPFPLRRSESISQPCHVSQGLGKPMLGACTKNTLLRLGWGVENGYAWYIPQTPQHRGDGNTHQYEWSMFQSYCFKAYLSTLGIPSVWEHFIEINGLLHPSLSLLYLCTAPLLHSPSIFIQYYSGVPGAALP